MTEASRIQITPIAKAVTVVGGYARPGVTILDQNGPLSTCQVYMKQLTEIKGWRKLLKPLNIAFVKSGNSFTVSAPDLDILEHGDTASEALAELIDFVKADFEVMTKSSDNTLTDDAIALKRKYISYLGNA